MALKQSNSLQTEGVNIKEKEEVANTKPPTPLLPRTDHKVNVSHAQIERLVTTVTPREFPSDKPLTTPLGSGNKAAAKGSEMLNETVVPPEPPQSETDFKSDLTLLQGASSVIPTSPSPVEGSLLTTTVTPGKSSEKAYNDEPQSHVHNLESNVSAVTTAAALVDHLVLKHEIHTSSTSPLPSSSTPLSSSPSLLLSSSLSPSPPTPRIPSSLHSTTSISTTSSTTISTRPTYPATSPSVRLKVEKTTINTEHIKAENIYDLQGEPSMAMERVTGLSSPSTTQLSKTTASNKDLKTKLKLPNITTTTTQIPSSFHNVIYRSKTNVVSTSKSLLEAAVSTTNVPSTTTTPLMGSSSTTNSNQTHPEETAKSPNNGEVRIPLEKISVATLPRSANTSTPEIQGTIAAIVLPVIGALIILAIVIFIIRRRRGRNRGYRSKGNLDEENSSDITSALVLENTNNGSPHLPVIDEPLYAVVDKSKKRKNTETLSITDDTVPLQEFAVTTNGSCPVVRGSDDSLLQGLGARDDVDDVFPADDVKKIDDQPIYDVPPDESNYDDERDVEAVITSTDAHPSENKDKRDLNGLDAVKDQEDLTLVECDIYETAGGSNKDDDDSTYEIPDSPATVRARKSMVRRSRPSSIKIPVKLSVFDSSDSDSDLGSDFEEIAIRHKPVKSKEELNKGLNPPPIPLLPPESDNDSEYYLSPECHKHRPPGPGWKPFHDYDPVYVPHSDPAGMDRRVDNQNYVRGRQRSDSRVTHPYEEIQFGGIYATVDDAIAVSNGQPVSPENKPPLPPPLVPRRTRPISGMADMGRLSIQRATEPEKGQEPRYSGLIKDDVSDPDDDTPHEYTPLEYTKLRTSESGPMVSDDIKLMDDTDSETYTKYPAAPPLLKRRSSGESKNVVTNGDKPSMAYCPLIKNDETQEHSSNNAVSNGHDENQDVGENSSDSSDSYEPFDFHPLKHSKSATKRET